MKPKDFHLPGRHSQLHDNPKAHARRVTDLVAALLAARSPHLQTLKAWLSPAIGQADT